MYDGVLLWLLILVYFVFKVYNWLKLDDFL